MKSETILRQFDEKDRDQLVAITKDNMSPIVKSAWGQDWDEGFEAMFRKDLGSNGKIIVCAQDEKIIGYFWFSEPQRNSNIFIHSMQVKKQYQNKGLGRKMLKWMEAYAKEEKMVTMSLSVQPNNERAIELYKNFGFREIGTTEAGITMIRKLT